jgi:hypothetical protein
MKAPRTRRRWTWRYDLVFDVDLQPNPEASTPTEAVFMVQATGAHRERRRRRWGLVRR